MPLAISMYGCEVSSWVCLIFGRGAVWYTGAQMKCKSVCHERRKKKSSVALLSSRGAWPVGRLEIILFWSLLRRFQAWSRVLFHYGLQGRSQRIRGGIRRRSTSSGPPNIRRTWMCWGRARGGPPR